MTESDPERLRRTYRELADEELLSLGQASESLLPDARRELEKELSRREIAQVQKDEVRPKSKLSQIRDEQLRRRAALFRRRRIEEWFTSSSIILIGWVVGGGVWVVARLILVVPPERAKIFAAGIGIAAMIFSGIVGIVILHRRQRWRSQKGRSRLR